MTSLVLIGLLGGLITAISPCILPVLPVILVSGGVADGEGKDRKQAVAAKSATAQPAVVNNLGFTDATGLINLSGSGKAAGSAASTAAPTAASAAKSGKKRNSRPYQVVAGLVISFTFFTLLGSTILSLLNLPQDFIRWAGIVLLAVIGVAMIFPKLMHFLERPFERFGRVGGGGPSNGFLLGLVLGAAYVPCAGPVLAAVSVAGSTGKIGLDTVILAVSFGLGTAIPLLGFALAGREVAARVNAFRTRQRAIRVTAGVLMIALSGALVADLPAVLQRALPDYTKSAQASTDRLLHGTSTCKPGAENLGDCGELPKIVDPVAWLNTPNGGALATANQPGKVTLVDFYAYSCINCQRSVPGIQKLHETYKDAGLQIIGIHAPEYAFEKEVENVRAGSEKLGITYPVAVDSNLTTWESFNNHYWPAHYLADHTGKLRQLGFGEGGEATLEKHVRTLLQEANPGVALPAAVFSDDAPTVQGDRTAETYLGSDRVTRVAGAPIIPGTQDYSFPESMPTDTVALDGKWHVEGQHISPEGGPAKLRLNWHGKQVNLVASGQGELKWTFNGQSGSMQVPPVPNGLALIEGQEMVSGVLEIEVPQGVQLYSFTFG
ncbi:thiol-disulfide oxidoreductase [Actinomyces bovis]|uniref:Thiol-disulfide oxidoreductase n=1 Tax=Actinomyces bovis TaxID=1658 RepID=A0ABY1VM99_9ACTO|nr:cytochrome c biogenesis protein CcdA [Actinomyces bovis]SPT53236.1 thiol-disulfide oxidoreductase [Actinomyces bovis]VEG52487.1 thiol-disulfide oxidoreductase [Actinomyces israelii]